MAVNNSIDSTQELKPTSNVTFADMIVDNVTTDAGGALRTSTSAGNTTLLQAYDVDGAAYTTFATLTANDTPTFDLSSATTIGGSPIGTGDVVGPASSTDRAIVTWSGTGGDTVLNNPNASVDASGRILAGTGTTSNCSHAITGFPNYGLNSTGTLNLSLVLNGSNRISMDNNGTTVGINGTTTIANGLIVKRTASATDYVVQLSDYIIAITSTASVRTVTLPSGPNTAHTWVIKDESGAAGTNNINIVVAGGVKTINGATSYPINTDYGAATVYYNGTNYFVMNTAPATGYIGEQVQSAVALASAVALSSGTPTNISSIALTPGVWDISLVSGIYNTSGAAASVTNYISAISDVSATLPIGASYGNYRVDDKGTVDSTYLIQNQTIPAYRVTVASNTTYYHVVQLGIVSGDLGGFGRISAVRIE